MILLAMPFLSMLGGCSQRSATVVPEGIQARRFELVAANSTMLARLAPSREGAALVFMYPNQKSSLSLVGGNIKDRPAIMLYDPAGKTKLMVNTNPEGPAIAFFDEKDNPRIGMLVGAKRPEMHILSADNNRYLWSALPEVSKPTKKR